MSGSGDAVAPRADGLIDDMSAAEPVAATGARWEALSDRVMGGISTPAMTRETIAGRPAQRLTGRVRLENNGGFLQMALDLDPERRPVDASDWRGLRLSVIGNDESYGLHLRTTDVARPWQSYRASFAAGPEWRTLYLPFESFAPHRIEAPLAVDRLTRLGLVAIGRAFDADLAVSRIGFYR
ncbi:MAG: CIA30 family protein [Alphaproteobacteria bacterium]|nr:CIA30 family protein [Alphaproteobacteria bacterium]